MAWWRKGTQDEDDMVVVSLDLILEAISDGDLDAVIQAANGLGRSIYSVAEVKEMRQELELRKFGIRRN